MTKKMAGADPELQKRAEREVVKIMKLKYPSMRFDVCGFCDRWCVSSLGFGRLHPTCAADPEYLRQRAKEKKRAAKAPNADQGMLV